VTGAVAPGRHVALGWLAGAALGAAGGGGESAGAELGTPCAAWVVAADGLLGGAWGLVVAGLLLALRRRGFAAAGSAVFGAAAFPFVAAGLGLFANRTLLPGVHFLSPASLAVDGLAVVLAALACGTLTVAARRLLAGRTAPRVLVPLAAGSAALFAAGASAPFLLRPGTAARAPTVVLVSIDTLRPDRLSCGGDPRGASPEIDRIAREGALFAEAITVSPGSAASHAALLTARYPVSNGVWSNFSVMDGSVSTLAEILREKGFRTGGFVTNTFLGGRFRFDQGFDAYVESGVVERLEETSASVFFRSLALVQILDRLRSRLEPGYDPSFETALRWIGESGRPTFWFVHLMDVHSPYAPPHPWGPRFGAEREGRESGPLGARRNRFGWRPSEEAYLAEIRFADTKIGRLRRLLDELGRLDGACLVLTSDHGENLLDHEPNFSHGRTLYDATLRVLAAIRWPGRVPSGAVLPRPIENVDILPTLASLHGWERDSDWQGRDALDPSAETRAITWSQLGRDFAARTPAWKLVLAESGERRRYELATDPGEAAARPPAPEEAARIEDELARWTAEHATALYERSQVVGRDELAPETIEKLRALGYLD
jgi:arylsulfatase A-like enzyme